MYVKSVKGSYIKVYFDNDYSMFDEVFQKKLGSQGLSHVEFDIIRIS